KANRLPSVSASVDAGEQFGRTIDPTTNTFSPNATGFNSLRLNAGAQVFAGGLVHHSVKQAGWNVQAAQADAEQTMNTLGLQIAQAYLNILLAEEQLKTAERRIAQSGEQIRVTQKFIDSGTLPLADKFTAEAQLARDEQASVTVRNTVDLAYLSLKQLLQLEPDYELRIERPNPDSPTDALPANLSLSPIYAQASLTQPGVRAAGFRMKSAEEGVAIAKAGYYPTISLFANLSSNYSSRYPDYSRLQITGVELGPVEVYSIGGQDVPVRRYNATYELPTLGYFDQIDQNFGQGVGVSISIPIYQNGRTRLGVERARLAVLSSETQHLQAQQQLKNDIQTAIANARAGRKQMEAAQKTLSSLQLAYQNMEKRFAIGAVNTF
ncbi:MAG TPA: TolC family protein, partial [Saprospiraceae bacterium]|nr:TolC family protein [Saprospiraceae bacterium]